MELSKSRRKQLGIDFESVFKSEQEQLGNFVYHLPDTRAISGLIARSIGHTQFIAQKAICDFLVVKPGGHVIFYELKRTAQASFPLRNVEDHQVQSMMKLEQMGCDAWFLINFYRREKYARAPLVDVRCMLRPSKLNRLINEAKAIGRASIPQDLMIWGKTEGVDEYGRTEGTDIIDRRGFETRSGTDS